MEVRTISYRAWQVESENDVVNVTWNPKSGFSCEKHGRKMCPCKKEVLTRLNGGLNLGT